MAPEQFHPGPERRARRRLRARLRAVRRADRRAAVPARDRARRRCSPTCTTSRRGRRDTPGVPRGFDRVLARALAKAPEDRYPSAGDFGRAALAAAEGRSVTEEERSVARGAAAPTRAREGRLWSGRRTAADAPDPVAEQPPAPVEPAPIRTTARAAAPPVGVGLAASSRSPPRRSRSRVVPGGADTPPPGRAGLLRRGRAAGELVRLRLRRRGRRAHLAAADLRRAARHARATARTGRAPSSPPTRASSRATAITGFELEDLQAEGGPSGRATARYTVDLRRRKPTTGR